jgi:hypothetical protein
VSYTRRGWRPLNSGAAPRNEEHWSVPPTSTCSSSTSSLSSWREPPDAGNLVAAPHRAPCLARVARTSVHLQRPTTAELDLARAREPAGQTSDGGRCHQRDARLARPRGGSSPASSPTG